MGKIDRPQIGGPPEYELDVWDALIRVAAVCLAIVLVLGYFTGEEFQHTHILIGYALAAVVVTTIYWELVRPHNARFRGSIFNAATLVSVLRNARASPGKSTGAVAIIGVLLVLAVLALVTLALIVLTHSLWSAAAVDEMHEVVAYFSIGLVVFFVAVVLIASAEHLERALGRRPRR